MGCRFWPVSRFLFCKIFTCEILFAERFGEVMFGLILLIIALVLILTIIIFGVVIFMKIKSKVSEVSQLAFGTSDIAQGVRKMEAEYESTTKSVSAGTNIYLPQIKRDFPEFHYEEMKSRAENVLTSFLIGVDTNDYKRLAEGTNELEDSLLNRIQKSDALNRNEHFKEIRIHQMELHRYFHSAGRCSIVFQAAVQYKHWIEENGKVVKGSSERWEQARYNVTVIYIQDRDVIQNTETDGLGLVCPNCGAPIGNLGVKICPYCESAVVEFNIKTWGFSEVVES